MIMMPSISTALRPSALVMISATVLALLIHFSPTAEAVGDNIHVVSDKKVINFPGDVVFNLEAVGEADIVEVRLYYRVHPSGIWAYAYPELTPSQRVETRFSLYVSGSRYLPPGTELEYYYSIKDSNGNVLETKPETFLYVDGRFQWHTVHAGPLTLYWHDVPEQRARDVGLQVENSLNKIADLLQVNLDQPMRGIIYNSQSEAREAFPFQSETTTQEQLFQGFAFPDRGVFVGVGLHPDLIVHESAHLLMEEATSSPRAQVPAWVNEGFASYMEPGASGYGRGFANTPISDTMPLRHMHAIPGTSSAIRYFYRKSESVVGYLLENYRVETFRSFLDQLDQGEGTDEALSASYGFDLNELDRRWASPPGQEEQKDTSNNAFPFSYLDTVLLALLGLTVMGLMVANFVVRQLRKRRDGQGEWDRLTEEEWAGRP